MTAGDTMFAVSLAGSLFFSISPTAAKDKVILYLLLTMGPFAVVAPALGPIIDRSRGARRAMVVASAVGRAALCPFLARDIHSLLLFPEAFAMLVLSKVYLVTKGALVPEMAALGMLDGAATGPPVGGTDADSATDPWGTTAGPGPPGAPGPPDALVARGAGAGAGAGGPEDPSHPSLRHAGHSAIDDPGTGTETVEPDLATLNARLGLLASLSALVFAVPAVGLLKTRWSIQRHLVSIGVFAAAAAAGARLPVTSPAGRRGKRADGGLVAPSRSGTPVEMAPDFDRRWVGDEEDRPHCGPSPTPR